MLTILWRSQFHIAFYAAALAISITILFSTLLQKRTEKPQNKWFLALICILILNSTSEILSAIFEVLVQGSDKFDFWLYFSQNSYFVFHTALCPTLYDYISSVTGKSRRRSSIRTFIIHIPFIFTEILVFLNPIFHCVFYYDEQLQFTRNWGEYLIYIAAVLYFIHSVFQLLFSWHAINSRRSVALSYLFTLTFLGVVIQLFNQDIKTELFAEALALMGAMLSIESEDDRIDADTHIYNRRALQMDVHNILSLNESATIIYVKIDNANIIQRVTRSTNYDVFAIAVAEYLVTLVPRYKLYHPNKESFVIIINNRDKIHVDELIDQIRKRFNEGWQIYGTAFKLDATVLRTEVPSELKCYEDIVYIADTIIPPGVSINHAEIDWIKRKLDIEKAIRSSLLNNGFEVCYQPTYYTDGVKLHGAEALVRMNDRYVGSVSPEEFIPIAEQIGLVDQIDDFVLREVCVFIQSGAFHRFNFDCINVNLSVIQCLQPGFFDHVSDIVDSYNVNHSYINFEITESVGAEDYEALSKIAHKLKSEGFNLSMDDYGTGYSNIEGIFALDFDVVKIDKSILWNAQKSDRGRFILENSIKMIHDLGCKVLVEGVETEEQLHMLQKAGVDYLQGYYFSKPVPKAVFLDYLSN